MTKRLQRALLLNTKKVCTLSLAAVLAAGTMLAGCTQSQPASQQESASSTVAADSSAGQDDLSAYDLEFTDRDMNPSYDEASAVKVSLDGAGAHVEGSGTGVSIDGSTVTISQEGVYVLSGNLDDGQVVVECNKDDKAKVQLVLNGVTIHNSTGPAIRVNQAKKCFITLADGSVNKVSDGAGYVLDEDSDEPYATIYSKDNLTLQGSGSLEVDAAYKHGIVSKDDLVVTGGTYTVTAVEDALRGRDCLKVCGGTFNLTSGQDAVKSNNDTASDVGYVYIAGGTFNISAGDDAVHGESLLVVDGGDISIKESYEGLEAAKIYLRGGNIDVTSSDDGINASDGSGSDNQMGPGGMGDFAQGNGGMRFDKGADQQGALPDTSQGQGTDQQGANGSEPPALPDGASADMPQGKMAPDGSAPSGAGKGGMMPDAAGQGAAGADAAGQGATQGDAAQGTAGTDAAGRGATQGGTAQAGSDLVINISGGTIHVNAEGDGIDSNGSIVMTGGTLLVDGPTSNRDGAIDYETSATITGGTLIAVGSAGMVEAFTGGTQAFGMANVSGNAGSVVELKDASGKVLASMTAAKQFGNVVVSAPGLTSGQACTVEVDGTPTSITPGTEAISNMGGGFGGGRGARNQM